MSYLPRASDSCGCAPGKSLQPRFDVNHSYHYDPATPDARNAARFVKDVLVELGLADPRQLGYLPHSHYKRSECAICHCLQLLALPNGLVWTDLAPNAILTESSSA